MEIFKEANANVSNIAMEIAIWIRLARGVSRVGTLLWITYLDDNHCKLSVDRSGVG